MSVVTKFPNEYVEDGVECNGHGEKNEVNSEMVCVCDVGYKGILCGESININIFIIE